MRAAAVQLQSTTEIEDEPRVGRAPRARGSRGRRRAGGASRAARHSRRVGRLRGGRGEPRRPANHLGAQARKRARDRPRGRLDGGAPRGPRARLEHLRARGARRRDPRGLPQDPHVRRRGRRASSTASRSTPSPRTRSCSPRPRTALGLGLTICYDLRFPELYRILALRGARVITVPANFTSVTGEAHWEVLLRARAIENQVFVIAPGQGRRPGRRATATATR